MVIVVVPLYVARGDRFGELRGVPSFSRMSRLLETVVAFLKPLQTVQADANLCLFLGWLSGRGL